MKVLGIDASFTDTGWCFVANKLDHAPIFGHEEFAPVKTGRKTIKDEHPGNRFHAFGDFVAHLIIKYEPDLIAYERPAGQHSSMSALYGIRALTLRCACEQGVAFREIYPTSLKKWATGSGRADKALMRLCLKKRTGYDIDNDNIVDAFWLAIWGQGALI